MRPGSWIAGCTASLSMLVLVATSAAQAPPQEPSPRPVPTTPGTTPGSPGSPTGPLPPAPTKDEQPEVPPPAEAAPEPPRVPEDLLQSRTPVTDTPRVFVGPDLFNPPAHQGWITLTPSVTLSGEYNDNLFLTSRSRRDDVVFAITPGVTLSMRRPNYRFATGFHTSGELYLDEDELNNFGNSTRFFADWFYQVSPSVTLSLVDDFIFSRDTNAITSGGVSAGRQSAWRNTITPSVRWQATPNTGFGLFASHTILRLDENTIDLRDSDTYRLGLTADHRLSARLTGTAGIEGAYIDTSGEPSAYTVTPRVGLSYAVTPTLRVYGNAGPTLLERDGDTSVSPAVSAGLIQTYKFGFLQLGYDRAIVAETIGVSDRHAFFGSLVVPGLVRRLQLEFTPRYTITNPEAPSSADTVNTLSLNLAAKYQIVRNISVIGSYTFFHQTFDRNRNADIDQNRVFFGLQYAYPISIY